MKPLLDFAKMVDWISDKFGALAKWAVFVSCFISAANAIVRYGINYSSNAWLEIQWYLFSFVFLFCAGYTLLHNQHVRIDVISSNLSGRGRAWIDILGTLFFLLPMAIIGLFRMINELPQGGRDVEHRSIPMRMASWLQHLSPMQFLRTAGSMRAVQIGFFALLVSAPWYVAVGIRTEGDFLQEFFLREQLKAK